MPEKKDRIIFDTNLLISFLLTKDFTKLDKILANHNLVLIFSQELLEEFIEVANRPKFKKYFSFNDLTELLNQLSERAEIINVTSQIEVCRDPKDNFILSLAVDGKANYLLTGDKDLLELQKFENTVILKISAYLSNW